MFKFRLVLLKSFECNICLNFFSHSIFLIYISSWFCISHEKLWPIWVTLQNLVFIVNVSLAQYSDISSRVLSVEQKIFRLKNNPTGKVTHFVDHSHTIHSNTGFKWCVPVVSSVDRNPGDNLWCHGNMVAILTMLLVFQAFVSHGKLPWLTW